MALDLSWLLWGLPLAFALGWFASRLDLRQLRIENRRAPKAYFRGLNYLLNEQQDQAIDAFIEAVQNDPDTSELHFALGNLFRRRGEYERAVRVHEHLLSRGDLSQADRDRAQHALAMDFLKAGLLDRAEDALRKLQGTRFENEALLALLSIYERSRDWSQAAAIARALQASGAGDFSNRLAHYLCEQAQAASGPEDAAALLEEARRIAPEAARPAIEAARAQRAAGHALAAYELLALLAAQSPTQLGLVAAALADAAQACGRNAEAKALLERHYLENASLDVLEALVALEPDPAAQRGWYLQHLGREPSLVAATRCLNTETLAKPEHAAAIQRAVEHAARPLRRYRCAACGFESNRHFWQCPGCQAWDSFPARRVEEL